MLLLEDYIKLNKSFYKTDEDLFIYHCTDIGMTANIIWLTHSIMYCLENKKCLIIRSKNSPYVDDCGWEMIYKKFWIELDELSHKSIEYLINKELLCKDEYNKYKYTLWHHNNIFSKIMHYNHNNRLLNNIFKLQDIPDIMNYIIKNYFRLNDKFNDDVMNIYNMINIPKEYIAIHARLGDKKNENKYANLEDYVNIINNKNIKDIFVMTDDNRIINELKIKLGNNYNIFNNKLNKLEGFHLCKTHKGYCLRNNEIGYTQDEKYLHLCSLFCEMNIARNSTLFIGDFRSTVSAFIGLDIEDKDNKCIDVTRPEESSKQLIYLKIYWKYEDS